MDMMNMAPIYYQGIVADHIQTIRLRMARSSDVTRRRWP